MSGTNFPPIAELVPHDGDMVFLDRVVAAAQSTLTAEVRITERSALFDGAAGGVGAWAGIEYMAQAIAAHAGWLARQRGEAVKVGFLLGSRRYQCNVAQFDLGSVLHVHVQHALQGENGLAAFECRIDNVSEDGAGSQLAGATITVYQPDNLQEFLQRSE
jgi:predicted hotdog family 3-hydroxylacyl-ACP dehydratase